MGESLERQEENESRPHTLHNSITVFYKGLSRLRRSSFPSVIFYRGGSVGNKNTQHSERWEVSKREAEKERPTRQRSYQ